MHGEKLFERLNFCLELSILQELKKHSVKDVVRVCEPTYKVEELRKEGIEVTDLVFDDGTFPPSDVVDQWFELLRRRYFSSFSLIHLFNFHNLSVFLSTIFRGCVFVC